MDIRGEYFGEDEVCQRVGAVAVTDPTRPFEIDFEDLPGQIDGKPVSVVGFALVLPRAQWSQAVSTLADGLTVAQLLSEVTIEYAANSAPHRGLGHRQLVSKMDGPRLLNVLTQLSGRAPFPGLGSNRTIPADVGTAATGPSSAALLEALATGQKVSGDHLHGLGPFAVSTGGGASAVDERITVAFWVGERWGHEDAAMPAEVFKGAHGCKGADPGRITILLNTAVDGQAVTWSAGGAANEQAELYVVLRKSGAKQVAGNALEIVEKPFTRETQPIPAGHIAFLGFCKPLLLGAMESHDYTDVALTFDGTPMIESRVSDHLRLLNVLHTRQGAGFGYARTDAAYTANTQKGRRLNWCLPLIQAQQGASLLRMRGSDRDGCMKVRVVTSGETTHHLIVARYVVWDSAQRAALVQAAQSGCGEAVAVELQPNLRNGNKAASTALADGVPQVLVRDAATLAKAAMPK